MQPYFPPTRAKNPESGETSAAAAASWIEKHPVAFLLLSGFATATVSVLVTHYIGGYLRKREERAQLRGEAMEANALGTSPEYIENPEEEMYDRVSSMEERITQIAQHLGVRH